MDGRPTWTDCDEAGDYVVPNVLSPRDLVFRPDNMDETVPHTTFLSIVKFIRIWVPAQLICVFVLPCAKSRFSHDEAQF